MSQCSSLTLSSHPHISHTSITTACCTPLAITSTAHSSGLLATVETSEETLLEDVTCPPVIEELLASPEVLVIPDSPQYGSPCDRDVADKESVSQTTVIKDQGSLPPGEMGKEEEPKVCHGENILNTLASSILSLSKESSAKHTALPQLELVKPKLSSPAKLRFNLSSHLDLEPLPVPLNTNSLTQIQCLSTEKEDLAEDSDEELEMPILSNDETILSAYKTTSSTQEQSGSHVLEGEGSSVSRAESAAIRDSDSKLKAECHNVKQDEAHRSNSVEQSEIAQGQETSDPQQNTATPRQNDVCTTITVTDTAVEGDQCKEPSAKRRKVEDTEPLTTLLHNQSSTSSTDDHLPHICSHSSNNELLQIERIDCQETSSLLSSSRDASLPSTPLHFPQEPSDLADDGLSTVGQALPMECAREHALIPNLPRCAQQQRQNSDSGDSEDEGEGSLPIVDLPEQARLSNERHHELTLDDHKTSLTVESALEHQIVPDLSLDPSFSSKPFYLEEQKEKEKTETNGSLMTALEDENFESMDDSSAVLDFALKAIESRNKTTQTAPRSVDLCDVDDQSTLDIRAPFTSHSSFLFKNSKGTY